MQRKLILVVVDSLRGDMLRRAIRAGSAPTFRRLHDRAELRADCVSSFPSVTPVCTAEICTGARPDRHLITGMNWYRRAEQRYVEYGSSFEATRAFGLFRSLYDTVYNLNMEHLSHATPTVFERLADAGLRTACTPFLLYRGRTRHEVGLEGLLKRAATAARFHHAVWGPEELFYGELYSSRKVNCKATLARAATRDAYSACVARELVADDAYDFLLFSLPDTDYYSHRDGPEGTEPAIGLADAALGELVAAHGGLTPFLERNAVIVVSDHAQSAVGERLDLAAGLGERWELLRPNAPLAAEDRIAVGPSGRGAAIWLLGEEASRRATAAALRRFIPDHVPEVELLAWRAGPAEAAVRRGEHELRFAPGGELRDRRGRSWSVDGDLGALGALTGDGLFLAPEYPDALARLWAALANPNAGDMLLSLREGVECLDWGGASHVPGGGHGSLRAGDSLATLLTVGLDPRGEHPDREEWAISDVAGLVASHFGVAPPPPTDGPGAEPRELRRTAAAGRGAA